MSRIGEQIKSARVEQKLSQKQLAKKVGVAEKYIQEVEEGAKIINQDILDKIIKAVDAPINDSIVFENYINEVVQEKPINVSVPKKSETQNEPEIQEIWSGALSGVLANISVFDYNLDKVLETKQLPIVSNKIEGQSKDKVIYIRIMDNDMSGFRIVKDDTAFALTTHQLDNNTICLLEYQDKRMIRQIKKLDNNNVLLISNHGSIRTETALLKEINILAKLLKVEFVL